MFEITFQPDAGILRWRLTGFWTVETAHRFNAALAEAMANARRTHERFNSLCDTREFPVQSAEVMTVLACMSQSPASEGSRKLAILVSTTLNSLQAERSLASDRIRVFRDEETALDWLAQTSSADSRAAKG